MVCDARLVAPVAALMSDAPLPPSRPADPRDDALAVVRRLRDAGHVAYFAGGCVRDALLGLTPKDYDVATDAPPERVRGLFPRTQAVGAAFGVILVRQGRSQVEVATFRADGKYTDGRRPEHVTFTTAEEDAKRRDFTINGMFYDPIEERVIDYVAGQEDLKNALLRAIGEPADRFAEDHLRLLRAIRFAARFGLTIEPATATALSMHAHELTRISPERITEELRLTLTPARTRVAAWGWLWKFGLLKVIFRGLPEQSDNPAPEERRSGPLFPHLHASEPVPFGLALAALVLCYRMAGRHPRSIIPLLDEPEVRRSVHACRTALRISNDEADVMTGCLQLAHLLWDEPPTVAVMKRFLATPNSGKARMLLAALLHSDSSLTRIHWLQGQFSNLESQGEIAPPPFVTGDDLTVAGLSPGRVFKKILDDVYDAQLEGRVGGKEEAMELALRIARGEG